MALVKAAGLQSRGGLRARGSFGERRAGLERMIGGGEGDGWSSHSRRGPDGMTSRVVFDQDHVGNGEDGEADEGDL